MRSRHWLYLAAGGVLIVGAFVWAFRAQPMPVEVAEVVRAPFELTVDEDGKTRVRNRYVISAPLAGRLARITLDPGDAVTAGKPVAQIAPSAPSLLDARTMRELKERVGAAEAQLEQAGAEAARAEVALTQARTDLARQRKLEDDGFLSAAARDQAELTVRVQTRALEAALAGREAARHALAQARVAAARSRLNGDGAALPVTSPVTGQVLRVLQQSEAVVGLGTPLLEVADAQDLEIVVDLLSTDAARVAPGARVHVEAGEVRREGRVRRIEPSAFTKVSALGVEEQRVNVIIDIDAPPPRTTAGGSSSANATPTGQLGDGYRVDLRIVILDQADVVVAPVAALFRSGGASGDDWSVFVLVDGRAERRAVKVGARGPLQAWIADGLAPGEQVIVYPSDTLASGRRVTVVRGR